MRRATTLLDASELQVVEVRCSCPAGHVDEEEAGGFEVVLPTSGLFRRRTSVGSATIDASVAYASRRGSGQRVEHVTDGDRCIAVLVGERLADELGVDDAPSLQRSREHEGLVAAARRGVDEEAWLGMLAALVRSRELLPPPRPQHQRAVDAVREAVAADPGGPWSLRALSTIAGYAPHHLSRVFRAATGTTLTEFRDRVRLGRAAELVAEGLPIAQVAADLGFADHGHLTRRARQVLGVVPSQLRA